jgi:hypothetical protein
MGAVSIYQIAMGGLTEQMGLDMSSLKLPAVLFAVGVSIFNLVISYTDKSAAGKVGLLGVVVANLMILLDHYTQYRKGKLLKAEIEKNAARITGWLVDNGVEFEQNGLNEYSLARAVKISAEQARTAIDRLESREIVVRSLVALGDPPCLLVKPGRNWTPTRDKLVVSHTAERQALEERVK